MIVPKLNYFVSVNRRTASIFAVMALLALPARSLARRAAAV